MEQTSAYQHRACIVANSNLQGLEPEKQPRILHCIQDYSAFLLPKFVLVKFVTS